MRSTAVAAALAASLLASPAAAQDAGDDFGSAQVISSPQVPGLWSVTDDLFVTAPDLFLGVFDGDGFPFNTNDDDSSLGNGFAPQLLSVPVNSGGEVDFAITGFGDDDFEGNHDESGPYTVDLTVFDSSGNFVDGFFFDLEFLDSGNVDFFFESNPSWDGGSYDVLVDNTPEGGGGEGGDIDFFRFTGLPPGEAFLAETGLPSGSGGVGDPTDTLLALYDATGAEIAINDAGGFGFASLLKGVVPTNGEVVLAVTGFPDFDFDGSHNISGEYTLDVTVGPLVEGDYNGNGQVDAFDYEEWEFAFGLTGPGQVPDGNDDLVVNAADYTIWRDALAAAVAVPEPTAAGLAMLVAFSLARPRPG